MTAIEPYQRLAYRIFGPPIEKGSSPTRRHLDTVLPQADISMRPATYLAICYLNGVITFVVSGAILALLAVAAGGGLIPLGPAGLLIAVPVPLALSIVAWSISVAYPDMRASERGNKIDVQLPYALNYMVTMAEAGIPPERIFATLADQPVYGEVSKEAARIDRDIRLLGKDSLEALADAASRTPSPKFADFAEGAITTLSSGGDFGDYLSTLHAQLRQDQRQDQEQFIDNLSLVSEAFISVGVAGPLLFIIMATVIIAFGGATNPLQLGYIFALAILPLVHAGFAVTVDYLTPEV